MADHSPDPDAIGAPSAAPDRSSTSGYPGTPRWVKVFGIVIIILVLLVVVMVASGGHGPGRHRPLFDAQGRVLGVEYEVLVDAVSGPPRLFGRSFVRLPTHPGVAHEHFALYLSFIENPAGRARHGGGR